MIAFWNQTALPAILSNYELKDVFKADEFGLFFQCLPKKTFHFKDKRCSGGKSSKARLTKMLAASAIGVKLPMLVIRKSKNPLYFKNVNCLLCSYKAQKKFWIDSQIFGYGSANVTKNFAQKVEQQPFLLRTVQCIHQFPTWPIFNWSSCPRLLPQFSNRLTT